MSSYQKRHFDDLATRLNCEHIPIAGFLNSGYVKGKKPKLVEPEYEIGTVGRCDPRDKMLVSIENSSQKNRHQKSGDIWNYKSRALCLSILLEKPKMGWSQMGFGI